jgi:hypothetical protein
MKTGINNQPPRPQISFSKTNKHFTAATPPSKGGETYLTLQYPDIEFNTPSRIKYTNPYSVSLG